MHWLSLDEMMTGVKVPEGYAIEQLRREDVPTLTTLLTRWYPDIVVGMESRHLENDFYYEHCALRGDPTDRSVYAIVCRPTGSDDIVALMTLEKNARARQITSPMGAVEPSQRGMGIGQIGPGMLDSAGRAIGADLAIYFATLKIARTQLNAEKCGFMLVGIAPAHDVDAVSPGVHKRVYEAIYAKTLCSSERVQLPTWKAMTAKTKALYTFLYGKHPEQD